MARLFAPPKLIQVRVGGTGEPYSVAVDGVWQRAYVRNRWRVDDGWWRPASETRRDYFQISTSLGLFGVIYREETTGEWLLERILD